MKLYSWNINGFRAMSAKQDWEWFQLTDGDIIALQETKAELSQIPEEHQQPKGYYATWLSSQKKKGYSGVATFSKIEPLNTSVELPTLDYQGEGRLIHLELPQFHFFNIYFPNGQMGEDRLQYKLGYYDAFLSFIEKLRREKPIVVCGDFNTAHKPIDIARPKENEKVSGFLPIERAWLDKFVSYGYVDTFRHIHNNEADKYTWWSYRFKARERNVGWRIDYFFVSSELIPHIADAWIEDSVKGSDHCPIGLELTF